MSITWEPDDSGLTLADIQAKRAYSFVAHAMRASKRMTWRFCSKCGLVEYRNDVTEWCVRMGCNAGVHPGFREVLARSSKREAA